MSAVATSYGTSIEAAVAELVGALDSAAVGGTRRNSPTSQATRWLALELLCGSADAVEHDVDPEVAELAVQLRAQLAAALGDDDIETLVVEARYAWAHALAGAVVTRSQAATRATVSDRIDRVVTHRLLGLPVAMAVMWLLFVLTTTVAAPMQDALERLVTGSGASGVHAALGAVGLGHGWLESFLVNGVAAGIGTVLTFVPVMAVMYLGLTALEESGYLARIAFVMDRPLRRLGLPGRAFLPLLVGFGCSVPAFAGTRILSGRDRVLTALLVPYVTCGARLPVYVLLAGIFFPQQAGTAVFALYVLSILLVLGVGAALSRTVLRGRERSPFVLELPPYRVPALRPTARAVWARVAGFLRNAGGIILAAVIAVWLLTAVAVSGAHRFGDVPLEDSAFGAIASAVAPALAPAGFGDIHASGALITGLVAKEAVVTGFAQGYAGEGGQPTDAIRRGFERSSGGHPEAAAMAFLVFVLVYTPCFAAVTAQHAEIGRRWTAFGVGLQTVLAWGFAVGVFQLLRLLL